MTIGAAINNALSGLAASQTGIRTVSNNIANLNTPGFVRNETAFEARNFGGVDVAAIERQANQFLQAASLLAAGTAQGGRVEADLLNRAQALFGDPTSGASLFGAIDRAFASLGAISFDPNSAATRTQAIGDLNALFTEIETAAAGVQALRAEANSNLVASADRANALLSEIATLNGAIASAQASGGAADLLNAQSQAIDELAGLIDIRVIPRGQGGVEIRTNNGVLLASDQPFRLEVDTPGAVSPDSTFGPVTLVSPFTGGRTDITADIQGGEIRGFIDARDGALVDVADGLGALAAGAIGALNEAANGASAVPAPAILQGANTGLLASDSLNFNGASAIGLVNAQGQLVRRLDIDFAAGTVSDGTTTLAIGGTIGSLTAALDSLLGADGDANFAQGSLSLSAAGGGLVLQDDPANPAQRAGLGFAATFGLNDLIETNAPTRFETGLVATDALGLTAAGTIEARLRDASGAVIAERSIAVPATDSVGDFVAALNDPATGFGGLFSFSFDAATGRINAAPVAGREGARLDILNDTTLRGDTGFSLTTVFGLGGGASAQRAFNANVRPDIAANSNRLPGAQADVVGVAIGGLSIASGDTRGALALQAAAETARSFDGSGLLGAQTASLTDFASRLAGAVGSVANSAESAAGRAETFASTALERRTNAEGVNLDEELVLLTQFQQSFAASARVLQTADELFDVLLSI